MEGRAHYSLQRKALGIHVLLLSFCYLNGIGNVIMVLE